MKTAEDIDYEAVTRHNLATITHTLNSGNKIPVMGLGTWRADPEKLKDAIKQAVRFGYRHIDCARINGNEKQVGEALRELFSQGVVDRQHLFITSKAFPDRYGEKARQSRTESLQELGLDYLDLLLIDWPIRIQNDPLPQPLWDDQGNLHPDLKISEEFMDTWKVFEKLKQEGKVKDIGVSNFNKRQIEEILGNSNTVPAVNQIEVHPFLPQTELCEYCREKGIAVEAFSPLGSADNTLVQRMNLPKILEHPVVKEIAKEIEATEAQVLLRWSLEKGYIPIFGSTEIEHIKGNARALDFVLRQRHMERLDGLGGENVRYVPGFLPLIRA
ncbi:Aldose reductase [Balamuthia mandrillaris]